MKAYIDWINKIYFDLKWNKICSRADFWQFAAIAATELAVKLNNQDERLQQEYKMPGDLMTFRWGRRDCNTSPFTSEIHEFPEATMNGTMMFKYFKDHYKFTKREVKKFEPILSV